MNVEIINQSHHPLPAYATEGASGLDIRAYIQESITLLPLQRVLVNTGLYIALPEGLEAQIRPRSGLAFKHGITVLNTPGTIDSDYRGEVKVLLINLSDQPFTIQDGERIAQLVIAPYIKISWSSVTSLSTTDRGAGGYGSTGIQ
ncbi:deoxyuridine 5'-triphosphate nucleotidohydrolase Dut [Candidatus Amoebophilus asiaticus 5a2]|uniref:Deoxyuridine 5'-triphosphate nucleotidohydrolase n=1 Tax=Amoebophilus asiaticus (strain 5a2) TaxID=452471 RepID=B3EUA6_AMOA5|nr:dUTP diphosphatase [Candidatus Amoebophilus asiaticus]ACE05525.1 deoxyuridine 5'-triphosphate nucleotidohydrolase Dut [Candidatus Amoebophilus asiaticus 5a2]